MPGNIPGNFLYMKNALVFGGSRGIGLAIGRRLKNEGYNVCLTFLNSSNVAKYLEGEGFFLIKGDISKERDVDNIYEEAIKRFGNISIVVNNAGISLPQKLLIDTSFEEIKRVIDVNLLGTIYSCKKASSIMLKDGGNIINVSSIWGYCGGVCESVYSASKAGVIMLTDVLSRELESSDISVSCIVPGLIDTDMNNHLSSVDKENFLIDNGIDRIGKPEDIANTLLDIIKMDKKESNGKLFFVKCGNLINK